MSLCKDYLLSNNDFMNIRISKEDNKIHIHDSKGNLLLYHLKDNKVIQINIYDNGYIEYIVE